MPQKSHFVLSTGPKLFEVLVLRHGSGRGREYVFVRGESIEDAKRKLSARSNWVVYSWAREVTA